jgi:hypothetical protein
MKYVNRCADLGPTPGSRLNASIRRATGGAADGVELEFIGPGALTFFKRSGNAIRGK